MIPMNVNGKDIVFYPTEEIVLEVNCFYTEDRQLPLPSGYTWADYGVPGKKRLEEVKKQHALPNVVEVGDLKLVVGEVYPSTRQVALPPGYVWGTMMYGLDEEGGVNKMLHYADEL